VLSFGLVVLMVGLIVSSGVASRGAGRRSETTTPLSGFAKNVTMENLEPDRAQVSLASLRGRPVVVNLWASWCVPCRKEMPALEAVYRQGRGRVAFIGVNHEDDRDAALKFVAKTGVTYPSGFDPRGKVATAYGLVGLPTTLCISADGRLLGRRTGAVTERELRATIVRFFGSRVLS